ncbi:cytochrome P450 [Patulibacter medicamentivorans]|uniref:Cytochrome P450 n=1 Tax=Patulibacter medicamentivorans TaxID=1097667 RepID=H0E0U8_9ACTN|nr:cytochrome P450 [Patulibacter medicamentivorans]EHN12712.1 cytochrome P450 [Patulibacter medicamentivorans]
MSTTTSLPPGPRMPRALQTTGFITRGPSFLKRCRERYGDMFTLRISGEGNWVMLADPEHVKQVFTGSPKVFHAGKGNQILLPLLGDHSVLLLDEDAHMRQRKLLLPPFHGKRMAGYGELMEQAARDEIATWPVGEALPAWPRMQNITLEVIMRAVFGVEDGARLDEVRAVLTTLLERVTHPVTMAMVAAMGPHRFRELGIVKRHLEPADEVVFRLIRARREAADLEQREDILSLLLQARHEDGRAMTDQELRDELMTLLVAGHETTATTLGWALERLVRHPDKLARLRDEVLAGEDAYLDAVVTETLRLRPVLAIVVRELQEDVQIGDHLLPKGTRVTPCIQLVHRRPDVYPDPDAFLPERWLDQKPGTYTWFPFGGGVRRCLGASFALFETKRVLAAIVAGVDLVPETPEGEQIRRRAITQTPAHGARVVVRAHTPRAAATASPSEPAVAGAGGR